MQALPDIELIDFPGTYSLQAISAEEQVAGWRRDGRLPFPDFDEPTRSDLRGTLTWPPDGSAVAGG